MQTLLRLVRYNAWGNEKVFALCRAADPVLLSDTAGGTIGSIEQTLIHLVAVEDMYLAMIGERDIEQEFGSQEAYLAHDLAWFTARSAGLPEGYLSLLAGQDDAWLARSLQVPWFDFPMTKRDGLLQSLMHSAQHRAQVLTTLGQRGVAVPDLDYANMLAEESASTSR